MRDALTTAGYASSVTGDPQEVPRLIRTKEPQLVVLDLVLPGVDGIELMESIPELAAIPVIFLSGYGREETIARALEAGAADYIVKPFSPAELTARVGAALRKRTRPGPFVVADLAINAGRVMTYESLLRQIWEDREDTEPVRTFVKKLRGKLGDDPASPAYIFNERGVGYRMVAPDDR